MQRATKLDWNTYNPLDESTTFKFTYRVVLLTFTDTIDVQIIQTQSAINFRDQFPVT
jgi:hypothetical protein